MTRKELPDTKARTAGSASEPRESLFVSGSRLNEIMSRTGSFPLAFAVKMLSRFGGQQSVVYDPFCGKGTTLLACRLLGFSAFGTDVAPEAVICSAAKLQDVRREELLQYVGRLSLNAPACDTVPEEVKVFFHEETLEQILAMRQRLLHDLEADDERTRANAVFTLSCLLGILHGHASYSLSLPCSHAFAMSPGYVMRYADTHGLQKPLRDVRGCLKAKIERVLTDDMPPPPSRSKVTYGSALRCTDIFPTLVGNVDIILTSPPYLNAQTYAKDNWLRLWLLGYDYRHIQQAYLQTGSIRRYVTAMTEFFEQAQAMLKAGGHLVLTAGDVRLRKSKQGVEEFRTCIVLAHLMQATTPNLTIETLETSAIPSHHRYLHALSSSNGHGKTTLVERTLVAVKSQP